MVSLALLPPEPSMMDRMSVVTPASSFDVPTEPTETLLSLGQPPQWVLEVPDDEVPDDALPPGIAVRRATE